MLHLPRHPRRASLVLATAASAFGSGVAGLAFTYLAYQISGSLVVAVVVLAVQAIPRLVLIGPARSLPVVLGIRATVIGAQLLLFTAYGVAAVLVALGYLSLPLLLVLSIVVGIVTSLDFPAWNQMLRAASADADSLVSLDAAIQSGGAIAHILGTLIGGAMLSAWGPTWLFAINAVSFIFPAVAVWGLGPLPSVQRNARPTSVWSTARFLFADTQLRKVVGASILVLLLAWPLLRLLPAVSADVLDSPMAFSLLLASFYAGGALTPLVVRYGKAHFSYDVMLERAVFVMTGSLVLILASAFVAAGVAHLLILMLFLAPMGLALTLSSTIFSASIQSAAPGARESEILAAYAAVLAIAAPIGALLVSGIGGHAGVWWGIAFELVGIALFFVVMRWKVGPMVRDAGAHDVGHRLLSHLSHQYGDPGSAEHRPVVVRSDVARSVEQPKPRTDS